VGLFRRRQSTSVAKLSGRTVNYGYDSLYRLTSETISGDPNGNNGTVGYTYDAVGKRKQISSTLSAIPATGLLYYDANDRTATDVYDNDGNTISSGGIENQYDFENHMIQHGAVTVVYDGDGNRVAETAAGVTTQYLVDTQNPTGYAQVVDELHAGAVSRSYTWGLQLVSKLETGNPSCQAPSTLKIPATHSIESQYKSVELGGFTPSNWLF
jgi:hypothetical protein